MGNEKEIVSFSGEASDSGENISKDAETGNNDQTDSSKKGENFLTEKQFDQKMDDFAKKMTSRSDKATDSKLKPLREQISDINKSHKQSLESGVEFTDAQKATLEKKRVDAIDEAAAKVDGTVLSDNERNQITTPDDSVSGKGKAETDAESEAVSKEVKALTKVATDIMDEVGARIYDDDPEAKLLKGSRDKSEYLANVKTAAEKKLARLNRDPATLGTGHKPGEGTVMDIKSNSALWDQVKDEI